MPGPDADSARSFAATFPDRIAAAMAEARGAMQGIVSSAAPGGELIDPDSLTRLHELYRLKVELEIETAGVLWRTAELVCALTDTLDVLRRRERPTPLPPLRWLPGVSGNSVQARRDQASADLDAQRSRQWLSSVAGNGTSPSRLASVASIHPDGGEHAAMPPGGGIDSSRDEGWPAGYERARAA